VTTITHLCRRISISDFLIWTDSVARGHVGVGFFGVHPRDAPSHPWYSDVVSRRDLLRSSAREVNPPGSAVRVESARLRAGRFEPTPLHRTPTVAQMIHAAVRTASPAVACVSFLIRNFLHSGPMARRTRRVPGPQKVSCCRDYGSFWPLSLTSLSPPLPVVCLFPFSPRLRRLLPLPCASGCPLWGVGKCILVPIRR